MAPERIPGFQAGFEAMQIPLVDDAKDLIDQIDAVLILSLCGAAHLERVAPFLDAGIPAFVDKPFACSLEDAVAMVDLSQRNNTLMWNGSALRFSDDGQSVAERRSQLGSLTGAITYGPAKRADGNPGLFHYGIHAVEVLFELMGTGCESVTTTWTEGSEVVTGRWADGRTGTVRGSRAGSTAYGFLAFCEHGLAAQSVSTRFAYRNLCRAIVQSLETGQPGVSHESSLDVVRFIVAALESERGNGRVVSLQDLQPS